MLSLSHISKTYTVGEIKTEALKDISLDFREREFVAILGESGSGKTTCLNIIGGLDRYDSGDLKIKGKSTKNFFDPDWDAYRNNSVGFVFQNYNLIPHLSIVANVELGMTLSGVSKQEKHDRALAMLEKVGLKEHLYKKPNQLSGGQMQRVAIARALVNDPEILLCDEPTGALDSETSVQIMDLIKEVGADRLVIMVTHNPQLAEKYADRIIKFSDGKIVSDSNPYVDETEKAKFSLKHTSMGFMTALGISFNNLRTKKGRTFLTCFASSIGIIGIAVILSLSTGFQRQIDKYQAESMAEFPVIISQNAVEMDVESMQQTREEMQSLMLGNKEYADTDYAVLFDSSKSKTIHENIFTDQYLDYIKNIDPSICKEIGYTRFTGLNLVRQKGDDYIPVTMSSGMTAQSQSSSPTMESMSSAGLTSYPQVIDETQANYIEQHYDLLYGEYPKDVSDIVLLVDTKNRIDMKVMSDMGFDTDGIENISFSDIVGTKIALINNDDYYVKSPYGTFIPGNDYASMYNSSDSTILNVCAVVRLKADEKVPILGNSFIYSDKLIDMVVEKNKDSQIVEAQLTSNENVISRGALDEDGKKQMLTYLGASSSPAIITIYPQDFESKEQVISYLDEYNRKVATTDDAVVYTDLASSLTELTSSIMDAITIVLIAFAAVSLVVSLIMICIITYTSVLERTKEIGVLKALGARKVDITRVFDAETFILGVFSGILGITIAYLLTIPINSYLYDITNLSGVANLQPLHALVLVIISTVLTMIGGHIPALIASKKDAVEALRSE